MKYYQTEGKYVLDDKGNPKEERNLFKWGAWFENNNNERIVKKTKVGKRTVSTVFLGLDYRFMPKPGDKPILWETMVFKNGEDVDGIQERYTSKISAVRGHNKIVKLLEEKLNK